MRRRVSGLVSVIVTNYNKSRYIKDCLNSLKRQAYKNIEIIVVDDRSTDRSVDIIRQWYRKNRMRLSHRMVLIRLPRNVGYAGALNVGLYSAKGEFIAIQDSDDVSSIHRIEHQIAFLKSNSDIGLVGANYAVFRSRPPTGSKGVSWIKYGDEIQQTYAKGGHCVCHGTILFRSVIFDQIGGPTRRFDGAEDYEFIAKCLAKGFKVENLPQVLYYYRRHAKQRSRRFYHRGELDDRVDGA